MAFQKKITNVVNTMMDSLQKRKKKWWKNWGWIKQLIGQEFRLSSPIKKKKKRLSSTTFCLIIKYDMIWHIDILIPTLLLLLSLCVSESVTVKLCPSEACFLFIFIYIKFLKPKPNNPTRFLSFYSFSLLVQSCAHGNWHKRFLLPALAHH